MAITVNYTPVAAVTELSQKAGEQAGKRWQAEYDQPFITQQIDNTNALDRLNLQINSNEKLQTSENAQRLKELDLNNAAAMERLQAGDYNAADRLNATIAADFAKLDTTISAEERSLAERNKAAMDLLQAGDYNAAARLQTQIDADLKKTYSTQNYEKNMMYRQAELAQQQQNAQNEYDWNKIGYEKTLAEQAEMNVISGRYQYDTAMELQKYQRDKAKEEEQNQKNLAEYEWTVKEIDNNPSITDKDKQTAKMIARSKIFGYNLKAEDLSVATVSEQIRQQTNTNKYITDQAKLQQGDVALRQGQQKIDQNATKLQQGDVALRQGQQKIDQNATKLQQDYDVDLQKLQYAASSAADKSATQINEFLTKSNISQDAQGNYVRSVWHPAKVKPDGIREVIEPGKWVETILPVNDQMVQSYQYLQSMAQQKAATAQRNGIPVINSPQEAMKLPKDTQFYDDKGILRTRP